MLPLDPFTLWISLVVGSQTIGLLLWFVFLKRSFGRVKISFANAEVLHSKTFSETVVSSNTTSTGGGGYVSPSHGGYVSSPSVQTSTTSTSIKVDQLFLRFASGIERSFELRNSPVIVRPGSSLQCMIAGESHKGKLLAMKNVQTGSSGVMREAPMSAFGYRLALAIVGPIELFIFVWPMIANHLSDAASRDKNLGFIFLLIGLTFIGSIVWSLRSAIVSAMCKSMISKRARIAFEAEAP